MAAPSILDRGTTVRIQAEIRNAANVLTNPDTITVQILDPSAADYQSTTAMTNSSTGVYLFDKQTDESDTAGIYEIIIRATSASLTSLIREKGFQLTIT